MDDVTGQHYATLSGAKRLSEYVCEADSSTYYYDRYSESGGLKKSPTKIYGNRVA